MTKYVIIFMLAVMGTLGILSYYHYDRAATLEYELVKLRGVARANEIAIESMIADADSREAVLVSRAENKELLYLEYKDKYEELAKRLSMESDWANQPIPDSLRQHFDSANTGRVQVP